MSPKYSPKRQTRSSITTASPSSTFPHQLTVRLLHPPPHSLPSQQTRTRHLRRAGFGNHQHLGKPPQPSNPSHHRPAFSCFSTTLPHPTAAGRHPAPTSFLDEHVRGQGVSVQNCALRVAVVERWFGRVGGDEGSSSTSEMVDVDA